MECKSTAIKLLRLKLMEVYFLELITHIVCHYFLGVFQQSSATEAARQKTVKASSLIAIALRCLDFLISYKVFRLRSLLKFQDFAVLFASPNNFHGVLDFVYVWWQCEKFGLRDNRPMHQVCRTSDVPAKWVKQRGPSPGGTPVQRRRGCSS